MVFNLCFGNNTMMFFRFFWIIVFYFLITAIIAYVFILTAGLARHAGKIMKEVKAEIETRLVTVETKISKSSI